MSQSGLILRIVPYSDSGKIVKCLTDRSGLQAFFLRTSKKSGGVGLVQTGSYIQFSISERPANISSFKDLQPDPSFLGAVLSVERFGVWLYTIELLNKTIEENFPIPGLRKKIDLFYTHLCHHTISNNPLTPTILIAHLLGVWDSSISLLPEEATIQADLRLLGIDAKLSKHQSSDPTFHAVLNTLKAHFGIRHISSLDLL